MTASFLPITPRQPPQLLSIVIPVYNEQDVLPLLRFSLEEFARTLPCATEFIIVNDGSHDGSLLYLLDWADRDERVKLLVLSRNFGHQIAVTAGLDIARGEAIVVMDADLQDPLDIIKIMLERYKEGYDVVFGQRLSRGGETLIKRGGAWLYYRFQHHLIHPELPVDVGDFRLLSARFLAVLRTMRERHRFLRGMGAWIGFSQIAVHYHRDPRAQGKTKYTLRRMLRLAADGAFSFSAVPMRAFMFLGLIVSLLGFLIGGYAFIQGAKYIIGLPVSADYNPGWATIVTLLCLTTGTLLISVGILGEYVSRVYDEAKGRPLYIVAMQRNIEP